jgi:hypothetical protein
MNEDAGPAETARDIAEYCRRVEEHLARVNEGHLIRIVGTGFELVRRWALTGVPLSVVCQGISQKAERHRAGRSTRPLRLEFCEPDVAAEFQTWCRAVGVTIEPTPAAEAAEPDRPAGRRRSSLSKHLGRAIDRLVAVAGRLDLSEGARDTLNHVVDRVAAIRDQAAGARASARESLHPQLEALDAELMTLARELTGPAAIEAIARDAAAEVESFRGRLAPEVWTDTIRRASDRLVRERLGLPVLTPDA